MVFTEAKCLSCGHEWTAYHPEETDTSKLECPNCHEQNSEVRNGEK